MIHVENVVKRYKEVIALDHFTFNAEKNEIIGLLGPNGCGKTTAINCMLSLLTFDSGEIKLFGKPVNPNDNDIKRRIGVVPQELALFDKLNVYENIDFFCGLYVTDKTKRKQLVEEAIQFVDLDKYRSFMPKKLSGGLKRRLNIACGIAHQPELIFLDEPTVAVDAQSRNFMIEGIKRMRENGATIVYTTHYLDEAEELCDRHVIMDNGKSVAQGTLTELQNSMTTEGSLKINFVETEEAVNAVLKKYPSISRIEKKNDNFYITFISSDEKLSDFLKFIDEEGLTYTELTSEKPSLSDIFLELTGKELRD
ncbi:ABC transporter ATP-binding protein [Aliicoccus persicus]|uniref:ABC-2 type transport system ATP-binding protein n=1 Tax=Aliicoccus persicus TaxID=930138 RepID=A0A662Z492_9STAP|nr:ABC transporter ATP-binding protein [Aliicoccus persicus]SEV88522.1 ABC-2 type transport system ATP-binding protein [Aliicoccus persicus]